ncbi:MAG: hypothetical protein LBK83_07510 [Treponema sp.]|nr:hypothetical protein [Treponema sp.]
MKGMDVFRGICFSVIAAGVCLAVAACDLLSNKPEIDLERAIDDAVAYANAARLTVEVSYPGDWGRSPQFGTLPSESVRQGFPFTVDFTVSAAYGFAGWRAYRTSDLHGTDQADFEVAARLSAEEALIVSGSADGKTEGQASVTININEAVTLVPWCEDRPRIILAAPPLINSGISYSRGQQIKIWFAAPLNKETVKFGEGFIEINGQTIEESSKPYDDEENTPGVDEKGDLTGQAEGAMRFFKDPVYEGSSNLIIINPADTGSLTGLPPGNIMITVTVGVNVLSPNDNGMTSPVTFYYRTNNQEVKNVYTAENIWAIHQPGKSPSVDKFFYTGADMSRDRRLRKNDLGQYEVTLYFAVAKSNLTEMNDDPTMFKVAELRYANLAGDTVMSPPGERDCTTETETMEDQNGSAGYIYRQNSNNGVNVTYHQITYKWTSDPQPGIIRLIVLPYRDTGTPDDFSDEGDFGPETWERAYADGRFVAVVLDNEPPSGNAVINATGSAGQAASAGGLTQYNYGKNNKLLSFTANFSGVADNGGFGIGLNRASLDKPWTMDNAADLEWQYQITDDGETAYPLDTSLDAVTPTGDAVWKAVNVDPALNAVTGLDLSNVISSTNKVRDLNLRYRDAVGNVSGWFTGARIYYYEDNLSAVKDWDAAYNPDANTITVNWKNPTTDFERAEAFYTVEGSGGASLTVENAKAGGGTASAVITGVPRQDVSGVQNGTPVTGGRRYDITVRVHSVTSQLDTSFKIWNFGTPGVTDSGMWVSNTYPAEEIGTQTELAEMKTGDANANKKYVLVNDIPLTGTWSPKGISLATAFKGKFYGNGHTISGFKPAVATYTGLFGYTSGAEIRDLKVTVASTNVLSGSIGYMGAVAGFADSSKLLNLIVEVPSGCVLGFSTTYSYGKSVGGIVGYLENSTIDNCRAEGAGTLRVASETSSSFMMTAGGIASFIHASSGIRDCSAVLAVEVTSGGSMAGPLYGGGIAGGFNTTGSVLGYAISRCRASGDVTVTANTSSTIYVGGAAGNCENPSLIDNITASGTVTMNKGASGGYNYCGGIIGNNDSTSIENCEFNGRIVIPDTFGASTTTYVGGIAGYYRTTSEISPTVSNSIARGTLLIQSRGDGQMNIGGVFGYIVGASGCPVKAENCLYENGDITALRTLGSGIFSVGGFAGSIGSYSSFTNCRSLAGSVSAHSTRTINIGGFAGGLNGSTIEGCYALTDVFSTGSAAQYTGGLVGSATNSAVISRCYAAGSVQATSTDGTENFYTGGLVGNGANPTIRDSYTLGNVLADKTAGAGWVHAGGLAGVPTGNGAIIERCFSAGTVTARSNGTGTLYAGGIVAQTSNGTPTLQNCAALGASVTAKGSGTRNIGRVYGVAVGTPSGNYAADTMLIFSDNNYNAPYPGVAALSPTPATGNKHGADVTDSGLRGGTFWDGLGFSAGWDFSRVYSKRHPALVGLGGQ